MRKRKHDDEIDAELIAKGRDVVNEFNEDKEFLVIPSKRSSKLISIRIPVAMMAKLKGVAFKRGEIGYQKIIKEYIHKGLREEIEIISSHAKSDFSNELLPTTSESFPQEECEIGWKSNFEEASESAAYK